MFSSERIETIGAICSAQRAVIFFAENDMIEPLDIDMLAFRPLGANVEQRIIFRLGFHLKFLWEAMPQDRAEVR